MAISRLSSRLYPNKGGPQEEDWKQFVMDHKLFLRRGSRVISLTTYDMMRYKYRPVEFFYEKGCASSEYTWIYMLINDIRSPEEFNTAITRLLIPDYSAILKLRALYEQRPV